MKPLVRGSLASHSMAQAFAAEVARVHHRYATEVVLAHGLCPFLRDTSTGFGHFAVVLDRAPDPAAALALTRALRADGGGVTHLVYPLVEGPANLFERFASAFGASVREALGGSSAPVLATFHPKMAGRRETAHGLVGLLRHAPDPFVQLVPPGLHAGGTILAGSGIDSGRNVAEKNFASLGAAGIDAILAKLEEIRADRDASYAPFLEALAE